MLVLGTSVSVAAQDTLNVVPIINDTATQTVVQDVEGPYPRQQPNHKLHKLPLTFITHRFRHCPQSRISWSKSARLS